MATRSGGLLGLQGSPWAGALAGLGQGLLAAGSGGWQNFGPGLTQGIQGWQQQQTDRQRMQREQELFEFQKRKYEQEQQLAAQLSQQTAARDEAIKGTLSPYLDDDPTNDDGRIPRQMAGILMADPSKAYDVLSKYYEPAADDRTSGLKEYDEAVAQGFKGTFFDYKKALQAAGASTTKLDVHAPTQPMIGAIPPGYVAIPVGNGMFRYEKIPGGPAADEAATAAAAGEAKTAKEQQTGNIVIQDIDRALKLVDESFLPTTGYLGEKLSGLGGTAARDVKGLTDTIRSNAGFAELQAMRDSSPTGGALGQVTERELAFLQATIGNLEQSQSAGQFKDNLRRVKNVYLDIIHGPTGGPSREKLTFEAPASEDDGYTIEELP